MKITIMQILIQGGLQIPITEFDGGKSNITNIIVTIPDKITLKYRWHFYLTQWTGHMCIIQNPSQTH